MKRTIETTDIFKTLSDPTRMKILQVLFRAKRELCVNEIAEAVGVSHSATSHQLAKLEDRNMVTCFRRGQTMCYQIQDNTVTALLYNALQAVKA